MQNNKKPDITHTNTVYCKCSMLRDIHRTASLYTQLYYINKHSILYSILRILFKTKNFWISEYESDYHKPINNNGLSGCDQANWHSMLRYAVSI